MTSVSRNAQYSGGSGNNGADGGNGGASTGNGAILASGGSGNNGNNNVTGAAPIRTRKRLHRPSASN